LSRAEKKASEPRNLEKEMEGQLDLWGRRWPPHLDSQENQEKRDTEYRQQYERGNDRRRSGATYI